MSGPRTRCAPIVRRATSAARAHRPRSGARSRSRRRGASAIARPLEQEVDRRTDGRSPWCGRGAPGLRIHPTLGMWLKSQVLHDLVGSPRFLRTLTLAWSLASLARGRRPRRHSRQAGIHRARPHDQLRRLRRADRSHRARSLDSGRRNRRPRRDHAAELGGFFEVWAAVAKRQGVGGAREHRTSSPTRSPTSSTTHRPSCSSTISTRSTDWSSEGEHNDPDLVSRGGTLARRSSTRRARPDDPRVSYTARSTTSGRHGAAGPGRALGLAPDDVYLLSGPAYHAGPGGFVMSALFVGATTVVLPRWDARVVGARRSRTGSR